MFTVNIALNRVLHNNVLYCCFCFNDIKEDEKSCQVNDEMFLDSASSEEMHEILSKVLGEQILDNLVTDTICHQCADLAIKTYKFINMCHNNTEQLKHAVLSLHNWSEEVIEESSNSKSLYLIIHDDKIDRYYDNKHNKRMPSMVLKRLKYVRKKSKQGTYNVQNYAIDFEFDDFDYNTIFYDKNKDKTKRRKRMKLDKLSEIIHDINNLNNIKCKTCLKDYPNLWSLKQHYFRMHAPKDFKCTECPRSFGTSFLLERHKNDCHCSVVCSQCGKTYTNAYSLRHHERSHKVQLICQTCGKIYKGKQSFNNHIELKLCEKMRKSNAEATFTCNYCEKKYSRKTALSVHIQLEHENGKAFLCEWCNKKFSSVSKLRDHTIKHTKQKNFSCELCGGKFVTKASLLYHTRTHTGERPYQCDHCDKRFLSASRRSEHVKRHHIPPSLECDVCHSKFKGKKSLLRHKKKHFDVRDRLCVPKFDENLVTF